MLTRRTMVGILAGTCLVPSSAFLGTTAFGESGGLPWFGLVNQAFEFLKRSGDLELELGAINLKLDQILANQLAFFEILKSMNETLEDVHKVVVDVPSETVSLNQVVDCQSLSQKVADTLSTLDKRAKDEQALKNLQTYRNELYDLANDLSAAVSATSRPPQLSIAGNHLLNAAWLVNRYHVDKKQPISATDAERFRAACFRLMTVLQVMTGEKGIKSRLPELQQKLELRKAEISKQRPFAQLLPQDYSAVQKDANLQQEKTATSPLCLMTAPVSKTLRAGPVKDFVSDTKMRTTGYFSETLYTRTLTTTQYDVTSRSAFGGRRIFDVIQKAPNTWGSETWSNTIYSKSGGSKVVATDPPARLEGCTQINDSGNGAPQAFGAFKGYLQAYSALVALESRLLALQQFAENDLKRSTRLYDGLKK